MTNTTVPIVLSVLCFLAATGLTGLGLGAALWARMTGRHPLARRFLQASGGLVATYLIALLLAGEVSGDRIVPPGGEKYFCELDCHLAYTVTMVEPDAVDGADAFLVSLRTRFDETTISPRRGRSAPTWPGPRRLTVIGSDGFRYAARERVGPGSVPISTELRPGESYLTRFAVTLPGGVTPVNLLLEDDIEISRILIGNERGPLHGRTMLALPAARPS